MATTGKKPQAPAPFTKLPTRGEVFKRVDRFFTTLAAGDAPAARNLLGPTLSDSQWKSMLRYLYDYALDVLPLKKRERHAFSDARWYGLITPPSKLDAEFLAEDDHTVKSALAVSWATRSRTLDKFLQREPCSVGDTMHINVCLWGQPTEVTASFQVVKQPGGFALDIPKFKIW